MYQKSTPLSTESSQEENIRAALDFYHQPGDVFELCGIGTDRFPKAVDGGFFNDHEKAVQATLRLTRDHFGVYTTLNPVSDALLARANNRVKHSLARTKDTEVILLRKLLVDIDVIGPTKISSTHAEHRAALDHAVLIASELTKEGWSDPLYGGSGNGAHLVYDLPDLPNTPNNVDLIKRVLLSLAKRFGTATLNVDTTVYNPSRLSKIYGTFVRKGDNTKDRPHRYARILRLPTEIKAISLELLNAMANPSAQKTTNSTGERFNVREYLDRYGIEVVGEKRHGSNTLYLLRECVFDSSHTEKEAAIGQTSAGLLFYQCFHNACKDKKWADARKQISGSDRIHSAPPASASTTSGTSKPSPENWSLAAELFPRREYPWQTLPPTLADSLRQLGRACASSDNHLPGTVMALMASVLGRTLEVSPKRGWTEPFIIWHCDIRESGTGKTPSTTMLMALIRKKQSTAHELYDEAVKEFRALPKKEQARTASPVRARGYYTTDLTLEGLRDDLAEHAHGGLVVVQDELSAFVSSQNQYKGKGSDREAWLSLYDGNSARVVRVGKTLHITGARVSLFGGIQPAVFAKCFNSEEGLYLVDGTIFRFLFSYEKSNHYELTRESWDDASRLTWETILSQATHWVDACIQAAGGIITQSTAMLLDMEAQDYFYAWRNDLSAQREFLPGPFRGFLSKAYGYALRLTGILNAIWRFSQNKEPASVLTLQDLQRGIQAVMFYLGQAVDGMRLIEDQDHQPDEVSDRAIHLAQVLDGLRSELDSGRLAVGFIHERYNQTSAKENSIRTPHAMGAFLRTMPLTITDRPHDANGRRAVYCLVWDVKTETFIEKSLHSLHSLHSQQASASTDADFENTKSA